METESLAAALEREHNDIDEGIAAFTASPWDPQPLERASRALDFTGWAAVEGVQPGGDGQPGFIAGRKHADNCLVHVPPEVVIAIHGGHCVRIDRARATIDKQGWAVRTAVPRSAIAVLTMALLAIGVLLMTQNR